MSYKSAHIYDMSTWKVFAEFEPIIKKLQDRHLINKEDTLWLCFDAISHKLHIRGNIRKEKSCATGSIKASKLPVDSLGNMNHNPFRIPIWDMINGSLHRFEVTFSICINGYRSIWSNVFCQDLGINHFVVGEAMHKIQENE